MWDLKSALDTIQYNGGTSPLESISRLAGNQQQGVAQGDQQNQQGGQGKLAGILSKILMSSGGAPVA